MRVIVLYAVLAILYFGVLLARNNCILCLFGISFLNCRSASTTNGNPSSFGSITATGGGKGLTTGVSGQPGGSGGGGGGAGVITYLKLDDLFDVDTPNLFDGSIICYNFSTGKWVSTNELNNLVIDGGTF